MRPPTTPAQRATTAFRFTMDFTASLPGARLARRLAQRRLQEWGHPKGTEIHDALALIVGELAANAVQHGTRPGEHFRLCMTATATAVRVTVTDTCGELPADRPSSGSNDESGRGLVLVAALADRWDVLHHPKGQSGKTIWAQVTLGRTPAEPPSRTADEEAGGPGVRPACHSVRPNRSTTSENTHACAQDFSPPPP